MLRRARSRLERRPERRQFGFEVGEADEVQSLDRRRRFERLNRFLAERRPRQRERFLDRTLTPGKLRELGFEIE